MNCAIKKTGNVKFLFAALAITGAIALLPLSASAQTVVAANTKTSATAASGTSSSENLRLMLDKIDLDLDTGKLDEAAGLIKKAKAKYPNNPEVLAAEADLNDRMSPQNGVAVSDVCLPNSLDPLNSDLLVRAEMKQNYACAGYNRRITTEAVEQIENLGGQVVLPYPGFSINADLENDHLNTKSEFTRANGKMLPFYGNRQQGTVTLNKNFSKDSIGSVSVYGIQNNAGAGVQYAMFDRWGGTSAEINFNKPDWDYVESIVEFGTKDNIKIQRRQVFTNDIQAILSGNYTHYSLHDDWSAADAPGWNFNLDWEHPFSFNSQGASSPSWSNNEITVGAHYGVEAQYFTYVGRRTDVDGDTFNPLPATSYEVHTFTGSLAKALLPNLNAQVNGGYGVNRIAGNSGPIYGGSITYTPWQRLGIDIHGSRDLLGGQNQGEKQDIVGTNVRFSW